MLLLTVLLFGFDQSAQGHAMADATYVIKHIKEASVACYGIEGAYPKDISYLKQHYGVQYDEQRYLVHYEWIADNLVPNIQVFVREGE